MRLGWRYDTFSDLAAAELEQVIGLPSSPAAPAPAAATASPPSALVATAAVVTTPPVAAANHAIRVDDVEAVPGLSERGRAGYRDWLTCKDPRSFVVSDGGAWYGTWGTKPKDPMDPHDTSERALKHCQDAGKSGCVLCAVDGNVVYAPTAPAANR